MKTNRKPPRDLRVGRLAVLQWLNERLQTDYSSVDHLTDAVAYVQLLHSVHEDRFSLKDLNCMC